MKGPSLDPIHTDALRHALQNDVLMEAMRRVIDAERWELSENMRAAVGQHSFHEAVLLEGQIQGIVSVITLLGRYGKVG